MRKQWGTRPSPSASIFVEGPLNLSVQKVLTNRLGV